MKIFYKATSEIAFRLLGHVLYKYLVYIRPFIEMLEREQLGDCSVRAQPH
jgi:hypothetical protein